MIAKDRALPISLLMLLFALPVQMKALKYAPIYTALTIRANKKLPPHAAYIDSANERNWNHWIEFEQKPKKVLLAGTPEVNQQGPYVLTQKRVLEPIVIRKNTEESVALNSQGFKTATQARQEIEAPNWIRDVVRMPQILDRKPEISIADLRAAKRIAGFIELRDGLAVTNEHHIEVRRSDEGVYREAGHVDLAKGYYSIDVADSSGTILARLVDKAGNVLGEGSFRVAQTPPSERLIYGPRLVVAPNPTWPVSVRSYYAPANSPAKQSPSREQTPTRTTALARELDLPTNQSGESKLENVVRGSSTVVRAAMAGHRVSNKIMVSGKESFDLIAFPDSMIEALKSIVEEPGVLRTELKETTVVWGRVTLDGKPVSGVSVTSETDSEAKAIYFNEFMIPDLKLTSTSTNGMYAFINIQQGFNAILAQRGEAYFGHQNVEVELGAVAIGDIQSSLRTESVKIRAFDAFSGAPVQLTASLQGLTQPVVLEEGVSFVSLAQVPRLSMIYTETDPQYVSANYFYNDQDTYIHLPVISKDWLDRLKAQAKIDQEPDVATIVGFFGEEDFEVYLAGETKNSSAKIVYFDATGNVISKGAAGGGFVMFNVPIKTQEVVVIGTESEKIYSKVVPTDLEATSVLNFTSY